MPTQFDLIITADAPNHTAEFRLLDAHGSQLAYRQTDFKTISRQPPAGSLRPAELPPAVRRGGKETAAVAEIGVCIAEEVLGQEIFEKLWESESPAHAAHPVAGGRGGGKPPRRRAGPRAVGNRPPQRRASRRWASATCSSASSTTCRPRPRSRWNWRPTNRCACCSSSPRRAARGRWARGRSGATCCGFLKRKSTRSAASSPISSPTASPANG